MLSYRNLLYKVYEDEKVEDILDALGCHNVHSEQSGNLIVAARPLGDNKRSVQIKNTEYLSGCIRSKGVYGSIYDIVMYIYELNNKEDARDFIMGVCGYTENTVYNPSPLKWLERIKKQRERNLIEANVLEPIDESVLNQFLYGEIAQFMDDSISLEILLEYKIGYDTMSRRITIPIYDIYGNLVGIKGRATNKIDAMDYKFFYLYPTDQSKTLFNYYKAKDDCILEGEVNLFEAEKSPMQAKAFGLLNTMGIGSSGISTRQLSLLLELDVDINLCYDEGTEYDTILEAYINFFKGKRNVYVLYNYNNILNSKESPSDRGLEVWTTLHNNRTQICTKEEL